MRKIAWAERFAFLDLPLIRARHALRL